MIHLWFFASALLALVVVGLTMTDDATAATRKQQELPTNPDVALGDAPEVKPKTSADGYPCAELVSDQVKATVYLPDATKGYYQGQRFDWSGIVEQIHYQGHTYFGHLHGGQPTTHDHVTGPACEFGTRSPLGYDDAKPGEPFVKIGVGRLEKAADEPYKFSRHYKEIDLPPWKVTRLDPATLVFEQTLSAKDGYGYHYTKTLRLDPRKPVLIISQQLKNTCSEPLDTSLYFHNFLSLDAEPIGPTYQMKFGFSPKLGATFEPHGFAELKADHELTFLKPLVEGKAIYMELEGFSDSDPAQNQATVSNSKSGTWIQITGSEPLTVFRVWSMPPVVCPENFVHLHIKPGAEQTWTTRYTLGVDKG